MHIQIPKIFQHVYPELLWKVRVKSNIIYLTFDDGPHPEITPKVLNILASFNAKASFFCVGDNVRKYPETFGQVVSAGHAVGNHTFHHIKGWSTPNAAYFEDVKACNALVHPSLFRPPYGRLKPSQVKYLKESYQLVMWSVISYDYDQKISPEKCLKIATKRTRAGDIVVFHDSQKAEKNLLYALPGFLEHFSAQGHQFEALSSK